MLVVDASIAVELSLDRMGNRPLREHKLVAPTLLWSEVPCALSQLAYRRDIGRDLVEQAFDRFVGGKIAIGERRPNRHARNAWRVAHDFGWAKTYDAEYVALAETLACRLVTLDARLRRGTDRLGYVITPQEL